MAADHSLRLRLAAEHLTTAAALLSSVAWEKMEDEQGFALTLSVHRDRIKVEAADCARWSDQEPA